MSDERANRVHLSPEEAEGLIGELQQQAVQLEELAEQLGTSEARLRGIVESALDAIVATDSRSTILEWNHQAETIFGWSAKEAIGRSLTQTIIPPQFRDGHDRGVRHYLTTGEGPILNQRIEITALHRDGHEFPVELTVAAARAGARVFFTSFIRDISQRKRAERQLAAQYAVTQVLANSATMGEACPRLLEAVCANLGWDMGVFWLVDLDREVLRSTHIWTAPGLETDSFERISRELVFRRGEGLPGRVWAGGEPSWIRDIGQEPEFPRRAAAASVGFRAGFAFPVQIADEFIGVMEFFQRAPAEPDRALLDAMVAMGSDIGQFIKRKEAEERLQRQEEQQRFFARVGTRLAASTPDYEETLRRVARLAVPALADWCTVYNVGDGGQVRRLEMAHANPDDAPLARQLEQYRSQPQQDHPVVRVIDSGEPLLLSEVPSELVERVAQDDEHLRLLRTLEVGSAMVVPLSARGRTLGAMLLMSAGSGRCYDAVDLGIAKEFAHRAALAVDNARLFAAAQEANRVKAEFLATMSHELRTPLNAMIGYTDLMLGGIPEPLPASLEGFARRVDRSARHLLQLIEEILAFSRLEAGRETVNLEVVDLKELATEVCTIIEPLAAEKGLDLVVAAPEHRTTISTDPRKVRQILVNLLGNAVKFTERGEIRFAAGIHDGEVVFEVRDTGIGIDPDHLQRIFEPFWQVTQRLTRTAGGTGLGLAVARRFVDLLGGRLEVDSAPGAGTTFRVRIPHPPPQSAPAS